MNNESKLDLWKQRVEDYKASGLTMKEWAKHHDVKYHQLLYWVKRLNELNQSTVQWLPVHVSSNEVEESLPIKIHAGPFEIEVDSESDLKTLKRVLKVLMEIC